MKCLNLMFSFARRIAGAITVSFAFFSISPGAWAGCSYDGPANAVSPSIPLVFEKTGYKLLGARYWYDDSRFPAGSLMGIDSFSVKPKACSDVGELAGHIVAVVYNPPANAQFMGNNTFRVPSDAPGVALDLQFPNATSHASGGLLLSRSIATAIGPSITEVRAQFPPFNVRISIVKTAGFSSQELASAITFASGLGAMRYYSGSNPTLVAASFNAMQMPPQYGDKYQAQAMAPSCEVIQVGTGPVGVLQKVIKMAPVSASDFRGIGAIDKSSAEAKLWFSCSGTAETRPTVYFDATYPFNNGTEGVGMPSANSDIGVQLQFNGLPISFHQRSAPLGWKKTPHDAVIVDANWGTLAPRGAYCRNNCDDAMAGPNWLDGGAIYKSDNGGFDSQITVRYFQTTSKAPAPQSFSVPFTVTIDVQ